MNEGSYNNVVRSNSPFSPMTPSSTTNSYKANVNRTKTRKWVEAKAQSYDGDDWGNEYEEDYDEPEQEPAPPAHPTSRIAALRQQATNAPQQRAFSQPTAVVDSNKTGSLDMRSPSGPPALHIQTGVDPRSRLAGSTSSAQSQTRFPPRESSMGRQETPSLRDIGAPGSGTESGRPSVESNYGRTDSNPSVSAIRSSIEQRQRASFESHNSSDNSRGLKQTLAPVEERKTRSQTLADETGLGTSLVNQRRLSTSPKLPDLSRMSGFGDDFFSSSGGSSPSGRPSLPQASDSQQTSVAGAKSGPSSRPDNNQRDTTGLYEEKHAPSALEGPKLQPNPKINMPPSDGDLEPKKEDPIRTSQQFAPSRPQLPGTWVSETVSAGSENPTPAERAEGPGSISLGSTANPVVSPMNSRHAEPADLEPTTTVKYLPSTQADSEAIASDKTAQESGEDSFNRPTGKHDGALASKVISSGPGFHPTPQFLPPLKTENPLVLSSATQKDAQDAPSNEMAPRSSGYDDSPSRSSFTQQNAATAGSGFAPTAPLNPRRSLAAPAELITPTIQERKSTMSTVDTASPEKESDKLREEIFKSLSASPATTTPDASVVLGSASGSYDPAPGGLTRESTYLSGVYDEYLSQPEDKSLQETGQLLKQGSKVATDATSSPNIQGETTFPNIAPLSPRRSPVQETARRPRRFSWENSADKNIQDPAGADPSAPAPSHSSTTTGQGEIKSTPGLELGVASTSSALQVQTEGPSPASHQVSQVSSQSPGDLSSILPEPLSPISLPPDAIPDARTATPDISRLSFADEKEKVLIQTSLRAPSNEQHPALSDPIELAPIPSPTIPSAPTAQSTSNAKVMAFRDILNLASIEQRIDKFDETRNQFYSMESGLSNWLSYMQSQPDVGAGLTSLGRQPVAQGQTSPSGIQPPAQQPYYQQYLNASNPGAPPAQTGRVPSGSLQHKFTGQPMSSFGPSGKEVGAKSKELLQAAGAFGNKGVKSGMKLFNKGKNKLRGTGDKVFF